MNIGDRVLVRQPGQPERIGLVMGFDPPTGPPHHIYIKWVRRIDTPDGVMSVFRDWVEAEWVSKAPEQAPTDTLPPG